LAADVDNWFTDYVQFMIERGHGNCPVQIGNCDETGFDLQRKAGKVLGPLAPKHMVYATP